jgi:sugar phosphate isomerase/epimerase
MSLSNAIAVSTWSVHHLLGVTYPNGPADPSGLGALPTFGVGDIKLLELPGELMRRGFTRAEICHFNLASQQAAYLTDVGKAFRDAGVVIQTLLIDDGDITDTMTHERDLAWISGWIEAAAVLGAANVRVIAGKQKPTAATLALSIKGLSAAAKLGRELGVRVVTENWFDLLASPKDVHHVLDSVGDNLGFLADTGNWHGESKYQDLASIFARAELCHAKTEFGPGLSIDAADFHACLTSAKSAGYTGPYTLVFESPGDEWGGLESERSFIQRFYAESPAT